MNVCQRQSISSIRFRYILKLSRAAAICTVMALAVFAQEPSNPSDNIGLPIFRFDDKHWFELGIPYRKPPENAIDIQEELNRNQLEKRMEEEGHSQLFSEDLDILNEIQLRYQLRFK